MKFIVIRKNSVYKSKEDILSKNNLIRGVSCIEFWSKSRNKWFRLFNKSIEKRFILHRMLFRCNRQFRW